MVKKSLFKSAKADVRKKKVFMIRSDVLADLEQVQIDAEKMGIMFPLNEHVEDAILRLVLRAREELGALHVGIREGAVDAVPGSNA